MSTAASGSPSLARSQSAHKPQPLQSYAPPESPSRTRSVAARTTGSPRNGSGMYGMQRPAAPPISNQAQLVNVARRDAEDPNLARTSSRRSTSKDRYHDSRPPPYRTDSGSSMHRANSRHGSRRPSAEMSHAPAAATNGTAAPQPASDRPSTANYQQGRRRTTITTQTGTWHLGKTIGQGSMGKVKIGKNIDTGETVAIKIVPRHTLDEHGNPKDERADRSKEIRTAREAAMASLLNHPFICGMRDVQRTNYHWYMLFEYVDGGQMLDYIISHGRLKEKQARKFGRQIVSALDYCHRNNIVHRDLKIENILISKTGDIKIIDFGLSNLFSPRSLLGTFCGSLYFAAPELLQARKYIGPEVDVWSFGIVLYVLVCGKVPFDDQSMPQLHAKIKRGVVDYPQWLSAECKSIISRMLVTDPKERASLSEVMNHPWMTKGFTGSPDNGMPAREPLSLPLDPEVISKMTGFDFGSEKYITDQLTGTIESEEYQNAVRRFLRDESSSKTDGEKKRGVFDFYKRRNSISRDNITSPSTDAIRGLDPTNAFSPLVSIYYLAREKMERERKESNPGALTMPQTPNERPLRLPDLPAPEAAHTNQHAYEIPGEKSTGGRARPRARTHGDEEVTSGLQRLNVSGARTGPTSPAIVEPSSEQSSKKESTAGALLRRLSTRKTRDAAQQAPSVNIQPPNDLASPPRKSFSVRRSRRRDESPSTSHGGGSQPQQDYLSAPDTASQPSRSKALGRSTSMNSADYRPRRMANRGISDSLDPARAPEAPGTSGSDRSSAAEQKQRTVEFSDQSAPVTPPLPAQRPAAATRTKSLGHARRESIQARRQRREEALRDREANVPEETDAELRAEDEGLSAPETPGADIPKPVYLKGLFSVSTTSSKPLPVIRQDIVRVLKQLGVQYEEIKGGFECRHAPSIDLEKVRDPMSPTATEDERGGRHLSGHQRKISFGAFRARDREDFRSDEQNKLSRHGSQRRPADRSFVTNSEGSEELVSTRGPTGDAAEHDMAATTTRVQADTGENLVLRFEIFIVKVPLFSLHGIQFKKVQGGMLQYRNMAKKILEALKL